MDRVSCDKGLKGYEVKDDGLTAFFSDDSEARGTLLVGADDKNSQVRQ